MLKFDLAVMSEAAVAAARKAEVVLMEGYRKGVTVQRKGEIDLVTEYDLRSQEVILSELRAAFPSHFFVAEEGVNTTRGQKDAFVWYVDPLDGTTNFAHGHPFFAVSIGLMLGDEPVLGIVSAPALGITWQATKGGGAVRNGVPCRVSSCTTLSEALCATGFSYDALETDDDNVRETAAFLRRTRGMRRCGSAAIDLAMVADGTFDLYWEQKLRPWDIAAGIVIVCEAGGRTTDYQGGSADPRNGAVLATNGKLHAFAHEVLETARRMPVEMGRKSSPA